MSQASSERRWRRGIARFLRHILRLDALRAFAIAVLALGVVVWVGADEPVGQAGLVVIGTLVSYVLLPDQPHRFWRVRSADLAETVPPSDLRSAGRETAMALALQAGGTIEATHAAALWDDAVERVALATSDPRRVVVDMDYRISVTQEPLRQHVRATISSKQCWPGASRVHFSFCSDVDALAAEFASEGSILREIVEPAPVEDMDVWERRVANYPVALVLDGRKIDEVSRETLRLSATSRAHRVVFDVTGTAITQVYAPIQVSSEFHQASSDHHFTMKFSTYFCVGSTRLSFEIDDPNAEIGVNDFMLDPSLDGEFFPQDGLSSTGRTFQTRGSSVLHPGSGVVFSWQPGELLAPVPDALEGLLPEGEPLPRCPELPNSLVATAGIPEPLTPITAGRCIDAYHRLGLLSSPRVLQARQSVVAQLAMAEKALQSMMPTGFGFVVLDGWRDAQLQAELVRYYEDLHQGEVHGYVADPESTTLRPPHVVGGALDLTLSFQGRPLALGSPYDDFSTLAHFDSYEHDDSTVRRLRRLMAAALLSADFAPYPLEWWHWSYGDDVWATFTGRDALYDVMASSDS